MHHDLYHVLHFKNRAMPSPSPSTFAFLPILAHNITPYPPILHPCKVKPFPFFYIPPPLLFSYLPPIKILFAIQIYLRQKPYFVLFSYKSFLLYHASITYFSGQIAFAIIVDDIHQLDGFSSSLFPLSCYYFPISCYS
jgi:hypothetical protein